MLKIESNFAAGIPQTIVAGFTPRGLAWHWTAGATGRAGALGTIQHFINTRLTINASYHILLWWDPVAQVTTAMWIVPATRASHSMNPANAFVPKTSSARETVRFGEVHRILARDTDPNADCISVSFCGMPGDLATAVKSPVFVADVRELARRLGGLPTIISRPHFGHGWIQPITRFEMDDAPGGADLLIATLYEKEEFVFKPRNPIVTQDWDTVVGPASTFIRPDGTTGFFSTSERVKSIASGSVGGVAYRLLDYGPDHEALLMPRSGLTNPRTASIGAQIKTVTKTVEVPTGITQAEVDAASAAGRTAGIKAAAASAAATK